MKMKAYLDIEDTARLEQAASGLRDRLLIRLLFRLGCRISEALSIRLKDIDFEQATVRIVHLKIREKILCPNCGARLCRKYQFCPGCANEVDEVIQRKQESRRMRILPIDKDTLNMLRRYVISQAKFHTGEQSRIFGINRHRAWQIVRDCADRAGITKLINSETGMPRGVSPHRLRDAFAVHAMKLDDSANALRLLQEHLGHANFNTTARYRKVAGEEHRQWYDALWAGKTDRSTIRN